MGLTHILNKYYPMSIGLTHILKDNIRRSILALPPPPCLPSPHLHSPQGPPLTPTPHFHPTPSPPLPLHPLNRTPIHLLSSTPLPTILPLLPPPSPNE